MLQNLGRQQGCYNEHAAPINHIKKQTQLCGLFLKARESFATVFSVAGHIGVSENPSDILTKPVSPSDFNKHAGLVLFERLSRDDHSSPQGELQD